VTFFHLELSRATMIDRRTARQAGIPITDIEDGAMNAEIQKARQHMNAWRGGVHYQHCPGWSAQRIATRMHLLHGKGLCDVAVIDYLQKIRLFRNRGQNDASAIGDQVEAIKNACEQLGICALVGSQINRQAHEYNRKTEHGIRGSGEVGEKSNLVITLDRAILEAPMLDSAGRIVAGVGQRSPEMIGRVDKNTMGPTGDFKLVMLPERFTISDMATERESEREPAEEIPF